MPWWLKLSSYVVTIQPCDQSCSVICYNMGNVYFSSNLSHHRLPYILRTDCTALWLDRFFWTSRFLFFSFFISLFCFRSVRHIYRLSSSVMRPQKYTNVKIKTASLTSCNIMRAKSILFSKAWKPMQDMIRSVPYYQFSTRQSDPGLAATNAVSMLSWATC